MNKKEIEEAINRYNQRLEEFGLTEEALGWGKKGRMKLRFEILASRWNLANSSVLDVGCGFGTLYDYFKEKNMENLHYFGIDINPKFIEIAKERVEDPNATFEVVNLLESPIDQKYDYVISSGIFNHRLSDNERFVVDMLNEFNRISQKGFAVNFLSDKVQYEYDYTYHANPAAILDLCYKYSNNVILRNDYMPFEFTVFVDKAEGIDGTSTVYNNYLKYV